MKKISILVLLLFIGQFGLQAQPTVAGIRTGQEYPVAVHPESVNCDTIFSFSPVHPFPTGIAFDGTFLYIGGAIADTGYHYYVYKYKTDGTLAGTFRTPWSSASDMDFDGRHLWMVSEQDGKVYKLDTATGAVLKSLTLRTSHPGDPNDYGCAWDNGYLWISEYIDRTLMMIDTATGAVIDSFSINRSLMPLKIVNGALYGVEFLDGGVSSMQLDKFDKTTGKVTDSLPWCLPYTLGFCRANDHIWGVSSANFGLTRIFKFGAMLISAPGITIQETDLTISPNPAASCVMVTAPAGSTLEILNLTGQVVRTIAGIGKEITIDVSDLSPGVYLIRATTGKGTAIRKFIKE